MQEQNSPQADKSSGNQKSSLRALDMICLFVAPLAGGAGNYMALLFAAGLHWGPDNIGILLAVMSASLALAQVPAGVLIDKTLQLKKLLIVALTVLIVAWLAIVLYPNFYMAVAALSLIGAACAIFMPATASVSFGLVGLKNFDMRIGRNGVFAHAGNVLTAICVGLCLYWLNSWAILALFISFALFAVIATSQINDQHLDYSHLREKKHEPASLHPLLGGFASLLKSPTSIFFTIAALFYTFADASMLLLMVQRIASTGSKTSSIRIPLALFVTEMIMIPVCYIAGKRAHFGRKPLLILSYIFLLIRGICFSFTDNPDIFVSFQVLDGISAGIFGLMLTLVISDFTLDTGRFNATLTTMGMLFTLINAMSNLVFGFIAGRFGFAMAFSIMTVSAAAGLLIIWAFVPETLNPKLLNNSSAA